MAQGPRDDPAKVAEQAFKALIDGEDKILAAPLRTKAMGLANAVLPDTVKAAPHRKMAEPKSGD